MRCGVCCCVLDAPGDIWSSVGQVTKREEVGCVRDSLIEGGRKYCSFNSTRSSKSARFLVPLICFRALMIGEPDVVKDGDGDFWDGSARVLLAVRLRFQWRRGPLFRNCFFFGQARRPPPTGRAPSKIPSMPPRSCMYRKIRNGMFSLFHRNWKRRNRKLRTLRDSATRPTAKTCWLWEVGH